MKKLIGLILAMMMLSGLMIPAAVGEMMYLIPDSDSRKLTYEELWQWNYESLGYILNEIFARHGYDFIPGGKYDNYFSSLPWYKPNNSNDKNRTCYRQLNSIEWYNEGLVKDVRQEMRNTGDYNKGGKSLWTNYSSGFDVLQGFEYVQFKTKQSLPVYSAPALSSWRGANGKAVVSANGAIYTAGEESGWLLVMYETNKGGVRVGYINKGQVKGKVEGSAYNEELGFSYLNSTVTTSCSLTDDPARQTTTIMNLRAGDQVTYLTSYFNRHSWAYVETTTPEGQICRGFIPSENLDLGMTETDEIGTDFDENGNG